MLKGGVPMRTIALKGISLVFAVLFAISALISVTYAWDNEQQVVNNIYGTKTKFNRVELVKLEKSEDATSDEFTIPNTAFYLFKANGDQIGGRYVTDENGKINVSLPAGNYYFEEASPAVGYTYDTDENGKHITKYEFSVKDDYELIKVKAYNIRVKGDLLIRKTVKNTDNSPLTDIQKKTEFTFTVTFSDNGSYAYRIDNGENKMLKSGDTLRLCDSETAVFENIPVGVLYNVTETPVKGYICESTGHRGNITENNSVANFVNRCDIDKMGSLTVSKKAVGSDDLNKEFTFTAKIGNITEVFTLKSGITKTFSGIPLGTKFTVSEEDADKYISTVKEYNGQIVNKETIFLQFNNIYQPSSTEEFGSLTVKKEVAEYDNSKDNKEKENTAEVDTDEEKIDLNKRFTFEVVFDDGKNKPQTQKFTLKAGESKTFKNLPKGIFYTVKETNVNDCLPIFNDISGVIAGGYTAEVTFKNIIPQKPETPKLTKLKVTKHLNGDLLDTDKSKAFAMTLLIDGKATEFLLKANETAEFEIPVGAVYELQEQNCFDDGFSQSVEKGSGIATEETVSITVTNTYAKEPRIEIKGTKSWKMGEYDNVKLPKEITVQLKNGDLLLEEKIVTSDENGEWSYSFVVPKYNADGTEAEYKIEELPITFYRASYDGYNIINTYVAPFEVELPDIVKKIKGENAPKTNFEFLFKGKANAPMPDGSNGNQKILKINGEGKTEVGKITFTEPGEYVYTVYELSGNESGWKYDTANYTITFILSDNGHNLSCKQTILKNDTETDSIVFVNTFDESELSQNIKITGTKTWIHGDNPEANRPESIIVYVYGDGELVAQRLVTAADNWKYSFDLPRRNENGDTIKYTIDESEVENYSKQISGYDLINTYDKAPTESQPNSNGNDSSGSRPSQTGDSRNPTLWIALMLLSLVMIVVTTYLGKKQKS